MAIRALCLLLTFICTTVRADLVELTWTPDGRFEYEAALPSGEFLEVCGALDQGDEVGWALRSDTPLDFNIHYHEGDEVVYPAEESASVALERILIVPVTQVYCWMLTNPQGVTATIGLSLGRSPAP